MQGPGGCRGHGPDVLVGQGWSRPAGTRLTKSGRHNAIQGGQQLNGIALDARDALSEKRAIDGPDGVGHRVPRLYIIVRVRCGQSRAPPLHCKLLFIMQDFVDALVKAGFGYRAVLHSGKDSIVGFRQGVWHQSTSGTPPGWLNGQPLRECRLFW